MERRDAQRDTQQHCSGESHEPARENLFNDMVSLLSVELVARMARIF